MKQNNLKASWKRFQQQNNFPNISQREILDIIDDTNTSALWSERVIRNAAIFSFLIAFCQNC